MSTQSSLSLLGMAGSLRRSSWNRGILRAAQEALPENVTLVLHELGEIPLYNQDLADASLPPAVHDLKLRVAFADGILIATPEYNYSVPGVLKNAIDWISRPPKESPFIGKPVAIIGVGGLAGTARAQQHLRQIAQSVGMIAMPKPELYIQRGWEKFDPAGNLTDGATRDALGDVMEAFVSWVRRMRGQSDSSR